MEPARKPATFQDLLSLADDVRAEVILGSVIALPRPLPRHSNVQRTLRSFVGKPFHDDDGFASHDRVTKRRLYAEHGVPFYWIVDPAEGTLEALRLENGAWVEAAVLDATAVARVPAFEAIELPLARLFPPPPAAPPPAG